MNLNEYLDSKVIKRKEIVNNFKKVGEQHIDSYEYKGCAFCGDTANQKRLPSESWTKVIYCYWCDTLSLVYEQDRMSGVSEDVFTFWKDL
jgi:hypothetical protein